MAIEIDPNTGAPIVKKDSIIQSLPPTEKEVNKPSDEPVFHSGDKAAAISGKDVGPSDEPKQGGPSNPGSGPDNPGNNIGLNQMNPSTQSEGSDSGFAVSTSIGQVVEEENKNLSRGDFLFKVRDILKRYTSDSQSYQKSLDEVEMIAKDIVFDGESPNQSDSSQSKIDLSRSDFNFNRTDSRGPSSEGF